MAHLFDISTTGLRFFTKAALEGNKIDVFNNGEMLRDFTYIDDIVEGITRVIDNPAKKDEKWSGKEKQISSAPYNNNPVKLITAIENKLGKTIEKNMMPIQAGDVSDLVEDINLKHLFNNFIEFFDYNK